MSLTLKEIIDTVLLEAGLATETAYADSDDDAIKRYVNLANRSLVRLRRHPWQALRKSWDFSLSTDTQYDLPADFGYLIPDTFYTDQSLYPVDLPANSGTWSYLKVSESSTGVMVQARLLGGKLHINSPNSGSVMRVEYVTKHAVVPASGDNKERFTADTDTTLIDDDLLTMDLLWRVKKLHGMDYRGDQDEFGFYELHLKGDDAGSKTIVPGADEDLSTEPYTDLWVNNA